MRRGGAGRGWRVCLCVRPAVRRSGEHDPPATFDGLDCERTRGKEVRWSARGANTSQSGPLQRCVWCTRVGRLDRACDVASQKIIQPAFSSDHVGDSKSSWSV
jgi:hypothetical protein